MNTIESGWQRFAEKAARAGVPPTASSALRFTYFAGAANVIDILVDITKRDLWARGGDELLATLVEEIRREMRAGGELSVREPRQ